MHMANILITGGRGGIGTRLKAHLTRSGHEVRILTRKPTNANKAEFNWNPDSLWIDPSALAQLNGIIHLAGDPVLGKRWTSAQKQYLLHSRTQGLACIAQALKKHAIQLDFFGGASAVGYYGLNPSAECKTEQSAAGNDFLGRLCVAWERAYDSIRPFCKRVVIFRIGLVLDANAGMLKALWPLYRWGLGTQIANGKAVYPWIDYRDLCRAVEQIMMSENHSHAVFNLVSPEITTQRAFHLALKKCSSIPNLLPPVPAFVLRVVLGESSCVLYKGNAIVPENLMQMQFKFTPYPLAETLRELLSLKG